MIVGMLNVDLHRSVRCFCASMSSLIDTSDFDLT